MEGGPIIIINQMFYWYISFDYFGNKACVAEERANKSSDFIDLLVGQDETLPII